MHIYAHLCELYFLLPQHDLLLSLDDGCENLSLFLFDGCYGRFQLDCSSFLILELRREVAVHQHVLRLELLVQALVGCACASFYVIYYVSVLRNCEK